MAKISAALLTCCVLATAASGQFLQNTLQGLLLKNTFELDQSNVNYFDQSHVKYYFACIRGGFDGFSQGLYNNASETISSACLDEKTYSHLDEFFTLVNTGKIVEVFKSFGRFYQFSFDVQKSCRFNDISFELAGFCLNKTNNCTVEKIVDNLQKSIFKLTAAANRIVEIIVTDFFSGQTIDLTDIKSAESTYFDLGKSFGQVLRTVIGFTYT